MRIGILFPVVIFITAVIFLTWFLLAATPRLGISEKNDDYYVDCGGCRRCRQPAWLVVMRNKQTARGRSVYVFSF